MSVGEIECLHSFVMNGARTSHGQVTQSKVFISWSGAASKYVALVLRQYIEEAFDAIHPFVSDRDIGAGSRSMEVIHNELRDSAAGLIIATRANQSAPWLNYEAGALGREVQDSQHKVIPLLLDFERLGDMQGPISVFQGVKPDFDGLLKVFEALCDISGLSRSRAQSKLTTYFEVLKSDIDGAIARAVRETPASVPPPSTDDKIDELLMSVRHLTLASDSVAESVKPVTAHQVAVRLNGWMKHNNVKGSALGQGDTLYIVQGDANQRDLLMESVVHFSTRGKIKHVTFTDDELVLSP